MRVEEVTRGLPPTKKIYLTDSYAKRCNSEILRVLKEKGSYYYVVPDSSVFHPLGGGQPSDQGWIRGRGFEAEVKKVLENDDVIVIYCKLMGGTLEEIAEQELDWERRYLIMRLHTAGHVIDRVIADLIGEAETLGAFHGPPRAYVDYKALIDESLLPEIERGANELLEGREVVVREVPSEDLEKVIYGAPNLGRLPKAERYRVVEVSYPTPEGCGLPAFRVGFAPTSSSASSRGSHLLHPIELVTPWAILVYPPQPMLHRSSEHPQTT